MLISPPEPPVVADPVQRAESLECAALPAGPVPTDGQLLKQYLQGRREVAFARLVSRFGALVYAVALRCLRDRHAAEDVFQATFLVLARDAAKIRRPQSLGAWLHGTALRISRRALARRRHEVSHPCLEHVMSADDDSLLEAISDQFQQQLVDEELQRLPAAYRDALVLHFLEGKSCQETAAALGISLGAVRGRLQRGKRELKLRLMKRGVEASAVMAALALWQSLAQAAVQPPLVDAAVAGGRALSAGTPLPPACSPEAVQLAAMETTMLTTTRLLVSSSALIGAVAVGWLAHAGMGTTPIPEVPPLPAVTSVESLAHPARNASWAALRLEDPLVLAAADDVPVTQENEDARPELVLKYGDGKPDGKKSIAGTGEMIRFTLPNTSQKLRHLRVHCARYGTTQPPEEDAEVTIVSEDGRDVIHTEFVPYATFKRGESRWTTIRLERELEVPQTFWVILQFNAERTKGVYVSYDTHSSGEHSRTGLPGGEPREVSFDGDWMVQAILTPPQ